MTTKATRSFNAKSSGFKLSILSTGHFFNDLYVAFCQHLSRSGLPPELSWPRRVFQHFPGRYSYFVQPVVGYISDRSALVAYNMGTYLYLYRRHLIPLSPSYGTALFRGRGRLAVHVSPPGTQRVTTLSQGRNVSLAFPLRYPWHYYESLFASQSTL